MPDLRDEFEALMPEPVMIGTSRFGTIFYAHNDASMRDFGRAVWDAATERAAKKERELEQAFLWCLRNLTQYANHEIRSDPSNGVMHAWEAIRAREGKGGAG